MHLMFFFRVERSGGKQKNGRRSVGFVERSIETGGGQQQYVPVRRHVPLTSPDERICVEDFFFVNSVNGHGLRNTTGHTRGNVQARETRRVGNGIAKINKNPT